MVFGGAWGDVLAGSFFWARVSCFVEDVRVRCWVLRHAWWFSGRARGLWLGLLVGGCAAVRVSILYLGDFCVGYAYLPQQRSRSHG